MPKIILTVGPQGSGKSQFARSLFDFVRISQDEMGKTGHMDKFNEALSKRENIIVDRINHLANQRERYLKPAIERGYETEIHVFYICYDTCLRRCLERKDHPSIKNENDAKKALACFFREYEPVQSSEANVIVPHHEIFPKINAVIFDLDGTLCDIKNRRHFLKQEKKDWRSFFAGIADDEKNEWCSDLIYRYRQNFQIILCTGRPEEYRDATTKWLNEHKIFYDRLFMRRFGSRRQDYVEKEILYDFEIASFYNVKLIVEDREQVVKMWRRKKITCLQCDEGDL